MNAVALRRDQFTLANCPWADDMHKAFKGIDYQPFSSGYFNEFGEHLWNNVASGLEFGSSQHLEAVLCMSDDEAAAFPRWLQLLGARILRRTNCLGGAREDFEALLIATDGDGIRPRVAEFGYSSSDDF